ncbi:MAG: ABC transporter substrate-binding protein [Candidatus Acetothermia bacterium]
MKKVSILLLTGLLLFGLSLVGFAQDTDTLVMGTTDRVTQLSPANSYDHYSWHVLRMCTDALLTIKPKTDEVAPSLAKDWEVGPDAQVYTFHLVEDATFTDGEPVNAEAVKWSLERALRLDGPEGGVGLIKMIDTIEVLDEYTVKITLKSPDATFLKRMTGQIGPALIWSPKSTPADEFAKGEFAGVGPYKLKSFTPDESVVYEAYDGYYGENAKTKNVVELKYTQSAQLRSAIESGDIDIAFRTLNPVDIVQLEEDSNLKTEHAAVSPSVRYLLFNVTHEQFGDERVRKAVSYAVNRNEIVEQVFSGVGKPIYTMVPEGWAGSLPTFPKQDLAKAESLLESAGYTEDNPLEAVLWFSPKHYGTTESDVAAVVQGSLNSLSNMDVKVKSLEWGAYTEQQSQGGFGMFFLGWYPDYLEASNFIAPWTTESPEGLGTFFNHHPNYDAYVKIMDTAKAIPDIEKRSALYESLQILSAEDVMWVPLWSNMAQAYVVTQDNVMNAYVDQTMDIHIPLIWKE